MERVSTTRMSSRGQVVIPEEIRKRLHLDAGARFVVMGEDDVVILKVIQPPSMDDFDDIIRDARSAARSAGMRKSDVAAAVRDARKR